MYISIENILIDETLYPRNLVYWQNIEKLMGALKVGNSLPPIIVGKRGGRHILIDGRHRCEAYRRLKKDKIPAILTRVEESQWFAEAVRLNCLHGQGLSYQERIRSAMILQRGKLSVDEIARIVQLTPDAIAKAVSQRGHWLNVDDIKPVVAKGPFAREARRKGRAWLEGAVQAGMDDEQRHLSGASFERLAGELLTLLNDDHIDSENAQIQGLVIALVSAGNDWLTKHVKEVA